MSKSPGNLPQEADTSSQTPSPKGRSQAVKSQEMRTRVIDAAISCLYRWGYSGSSTIAVAAEAGVSRGAMLHHFPSKVELMLAVMEEVIRRSNAKRREIILAEPRGAARFAAVTPAAWQTIQEPEAMTLLEILMASRGDAALAERLPDVVRTIEASQLDGVLELAEEIGIRNSRLIEAMSKLHQAAMRGLSIELLFTDDRSKVDDAMALLSWYKQLFTERALAGPGSNNFADIFNEARNPGSASR